MLRVHRDFKGLLKDVQDEYDFLVELNKSLQKKVTEWNKDKNMRKLNVTVQCMAVYNSSIMVPRELTFEEAIKYAKEHIDEINLGELEYISDSDELDEENCDFDEEEDTDSDCRVLYETGIEEPEILGSGSTYSNVVYSPDEERAFEEFHHCGRNYLHRITYRKKSPYTTTEWWDEDLKCWRS